MIDGDFPNGYNNDGPRDHSQFTSSGISDQQSPTGHLHPLVEPPYMPIPFGALDAIPATEEFARRVAVLSDEDYGDWMREVNANWLQYRQTLETKTNVTPEMRELLEQVHMMVQYQPDFRLSDTRRKTVMVLLRIRELLGAAEPLEIHQLGVSTTISTPSQAPDFALQLESHTPADVAPELATLLTPEQSQAHDQGR